MYSAVSQIYSICSVLSPIYISIPLFGDVTLLDRTGPDRTGPDRIGSDRIGPDRTATGPRPDRDRTATGPRPDRDLSRHLTVPFIKGWNVEECFVGYFYHWWLIQYCEKNSGLRSVIIRKKEILATPLRKTSQFAHFFRVLHKRVTAVMLYKMMKVRWWKDGKLDKANCYFWLLYVPWQWEWYWQ